MSAVNDGMPDYTRALTHPVFELHKRIDHAASIHLVVDPLLAQEQLDDV